MINYEDKLSEGKYGGLYAGQYKDELVIIDLFESSEGGAYYTIFDQHMDSVDGGLLDYNEDEATMRDVEAFMSLANKTVLIGKICDEGSNMYDIVTNAILNG